jgi:hypothetical protein
MYDLCSNCNVCGPLVPEQKYARVLNHKDDDARVLVLDQVHDAHTRIKALRIADYLLEDIPYTYTNVIRCDGFEPVTEEDYQSVVSRCAVWTHALLGDRSLILSARSGFKQMKIEREFIAGDAFRSQKLGLILCIPNLYLLLESDAMEYKSKVNRLLKEAKLR